MSALLLSEELFSELFLGADELFLEDGVERASTGRTCSMKRCGFAESASSSEDLFDFEDFKLSIAYVKPSLGYTCAPEPYFYF